MKIIGIRNKSATKDHMFFFSVESSDLNELKTASRKVQDLLGCEHVPKWHD